MQYKGFVIRLYPTKEQEEYFANCFGCVRFIEKLARTPPPQLSRWGMNCVIPITTCLIM